MIRTKEEPGTGNVAEAIKHMRILNNEVRRLRRIFHSGDEQELVRLSRELKVSYEFSEETARLGRLPVVNFAAGRIATPADAALMMTLGCDAVFVGSGILKPDDPKERARSIVLAVTYFEDARSVVDAQRTIDERKSMTGVGTTTKELSLKMQERGINV